MAPLPTFSWKGETVTFSFSGGVVTLRNFKHKSRKTEVVMLKPDHWLFLLPRKVEIQDVLITQNLLDVSYDRGEHFLYDLLRNKVVWEIDEMSRVDSDEELNYFHVYQFFWSRNDEPEGSKVE